MQFKRGGVDVIQSGELDLGASGDLVGVRSKLGVDLIVVHPQPRLLSRPSGNRNHQKQQDKKSCKRPKAAPRLKAHSGTSPGKSRRSLISMMKIVTQEMLVGQGIRSFFAVET